MSKDKARRVTRSELIVETWKRLNSESLGASELEEIQNVLASTFGESGVEGPASIARILADTGVTLRHPEILNSDSAWRDVHSFDSMGCGDLDFSTMEATVVSLNALDSLSDRLEEQQDARGMATLRAMVAAIRQQLRLLSRSAAVSELRQRAASEAEQWLEIWLQNPRIFEDWRELRMNSEEFRRVFGK